MSDRKRGGGRHHDSGGKLPREVLVSKKLSWLLRHGAQQEGLTMFPGGYVNVGDVLTTQKIRSMKITFDEIQQIVKDNDKQRFALILASSLDQSASKTDPTPAIAESGKEDSNETLAAIEHVSASSNPRDYLIRANQGHSLKLEDTGLLTPITSSNTPDLVVHGTTHSAWARIVASGGLKPMTRNHIHFARGLPSGFKTLVAGENESEREGKVAAPVISGMRSTSTILVYVDIEKAMQAGIEFGVSENGVILTAGNQEGVLPIEYFKRVEDRTGQGILVEDGKVVKEAPSVWSRTKAPGYKSHVS